MRALPTDVVVAISKVASSACRDSCFSGNPSKGEALLLGHPDSVIPSGRAAALSLLDLRERRRAKQMLRGCPE